MKRKLTNEQMDSQNWRYKKKTVPTDDYAHLNGPVHTIKPADPPKPIPKPEPYKPTSTLPHPYKCSKCVYIAPTLQASKRHWFDSH